MRVISITCIISAAAGLHCSYPLIQIRIVLPRYIVNEDKTGDDFSCAKQDSTLGRRICFLSYAFLIGSLTKWLRSVHSDIMESHTHSN